MLLWDSAAISYKIDQWFKVTKCSRMTACCFTQLDEQKMTHNPSFLKRIECLHNDLHEKNKIILTNVYITSVLHHDFLCTTAAENCDVCVLFICATVKSVNVSGRFVTEPLQHWGFVLCYPFNVGCGLLYGLLHGQSGRAKSNILVICFKFL